MTIRADVQSLQPGSEVKLFLVDGTMIDPAAGILAFHGMKYPYPIIWQGTEYQPWPITATGFAVKSDKPPNPKLSVGNLNGFITAMCLMYDDMIGAKVTVKTTLAKYLDPNNFKGANLLYESRVLVGGGWSSNGTGHTYTYNRPGPDGLNNATRVVRNAAGGGVFASANNRHPMVAGETYTVSADIKSDVLTRIRIVVDGLPNSGTTLATIGTGWSRVSFTGTAAGTLAGTILIYPVAADSAAPSFEVANVQLEPGPLATTFSAVNAGSGLNPTADPNEHYPDEVWYVDRKEHEDRNMVRWSLASALDFNGVVLPRRKVVANQCWWQYRSPECSYAGGPVATKLDVPTADPNLDMCSRRVSGCKLRFGADNPLPYGSFPASGLMK